MSRSLPLIFPFCLSNFNTGISIAFYLYHHFAWEFMKDLFFVTLLAQPIALYIVYLRVAWISMRPTQAPFLPDTVILQVLSLAGCLPFYITLGVLKLLPLSQAFLYLSPRNTTPQQWKVQAVHLPILIQAFSQCFPGLIIVLIDDLDLTSGWTILTIWSQVVMLVPAVVSLKHLLKTQSRRDV